MTNETSVNNPTYYIIKTEQVITAGGLRLTEKLPIGRVFTLASEHDHTKIDLKNNKIKKEILRV